jgi:DNA repair protein RecO (recombination protein O)
VVLLHDRALVLKRSPFGESSLVVHVLAREHGRVHLLAKGAYRPTSGYFAVLDFFDTLELEWSHSPRSELELLRKGSLAVRRRALSADLDRYRAALAILELADLAAHPSVADPAAFDHTEGALTALSDANLDPELVLAVHELGLLALLGLAPALERCASCGGPAPALHGSGARAAFSAGAGGRLCEGCAVRARATGRRVGTIPVAVLEAAARLSGVRWGAPLARVGSEAGPRGRALLERVRDLSLRFLGYHLDALPRTQRAFLAHENRNAPAPNET